MKLCKIERKGGFVSEMDNTGLLGEYKHTIDAKKRIFLPSDFRPFLGNEVVVSKSTDKCINVYPIPEWKKYEEKINALPSVKAKAIKRWVYAYSKRTEVDAQGRIAIPQNLCDYAELEKNIVSVGAGEYAEIWSEKAYAEMTGALSASDIEEDLIALGF